MATSALTRVEATSALTRMHGGGRISAARFEVALRELEGHWNRIEVHSVTDEVLQGAVRAAIDHALRAYDSLHLATALEFADIEKVTFACWDHELRDAARKHGFDLIPSQI
jgi:uncharacterized protein